VIKNLELTLEGVERQMHVGEAAAKRSADAADEANVKIHEHLAQCHEDVSLAMIDAADHTKDYGIRSERNRVLRLWYNFHINLEDSDGNEKKLPMSGWRNKQWSIRLGHAIAGGDESLWVGEEGMCDPECPVDAVFDGVSSEDDSGKMESSSVSVEFQTKLVKLMSKAGTQRNGIKAAWTLSEISYGFKAAMPQVGDDDLFLALKNLVVRKIVLERAMGKSVEMVYVLADNYESEMVSINPNFGQDKVEPVDEREELRNDLCDILQSNQDVDGTLLPWAIRPLLFALRYKFSWLHADDIAAAMLTIKECREVGDGKYLWVGKPF
jgi:hypothetical protein